MYIRTLILYITMMMRICAALRSQYVWWEVPQPLGVKVIQIQIIFLTEKIRIRAL